MLCKERGALLLEVWQAHTTLMRTVHTKLQASFPAYKCQASQHCMSSLSQVLHVQRRRSTTALQGHEHEPTAYQLRTMRRQQAGDETCGGLPHVCSQRLRKMARRQLVDARSSTSGVVTRPMRNIGVCNLQEEHQNACKCRSEHLRSNLQTYMRRWCLQRAGGVPERLQAHGAGGVGGAVRGGGAPRRAGAEQGRRCEAAGGRQVRSAWRHRSCLSRNSNNTTEAPRVRRMGSRSECTTLVRQGCYANALCMPVRWCWTKSQFRQDYHAWWQLAS